MGWIQKVKGALSSSGSVAEPVATEPQASAAPASETEASAPEGDWLDIEVVAPGPDAATCQLRFSRPVSPPGTSLFETPGEAADWPAVRALLSIPGVHSVIGKGEALVIAKREATSWPEILERVEGAIREAFDGAPSAPAAAASAPAAAKPMAPGEGGPLRERIERIIETEINPAVAAHGGVITLLDVQDTRVFIHMGGGCQGCAMSTATLKHGVEASLREQIPEITEILDTTDHAAGSNPYFQQGL
jgi:Fe-S cluster biogenesis protein NfuA